MAVLFLLLAFLIVVALAVAGLENGDPTTATVFDRSFGQLTEGQLLVLAAGLGFLVALFLFLAFGASRTRRSRRRELKSRRRDAESRVDELERENARLHQELETTERGRVDAVAERDRAETTADRVRASTSTDQTGLPSAPAGTAPVMDDPARPDDRTAGPPEPVSATRERLDDRTDVAAAREEHARADDDEARRR
jgi:type II secretory pathway pseudopilin PulG